MFKLYHMWLTKGRTCIFFPSWNPVEALIRTSFFESKSPRADCPIRGIEQIWIENYVVTGNRLSPRDSETDKRAPASWELIAQVLPQWADMKM